MATIYTRAAKGSALTWTEGDANITNLNNAKIEAVADDIAPQLGGDLDVLTNEIKTTTTNGSIVLRANGTGVIEAISDGFVVGNGTVGAVITSSGANNLILDTNDGLNSGSITITAGVNGDILLEPNGTGAVVLGTLSFPTADGTSGQVLTTDGTGTLSWTTVSSGSSTLNGLSDVTITTPSNGQVLSYNSSTSEWVNSTISSGGITDVVQDTTPQLGGNLDVNGQSIVSVSNGNISITPNGTGQTQIKNIEYNEAIFSLGTTSGTITPNVANGNVQTITLNGNLTFSAFTSPVAGQSLTLIITQDATGGRTLTSTMKFAGAIKTLSGTANAVDIMTVFYDGTNYWASLAKGFA